MYELTFFDSEANKYIGLATTLVRCDGSASQSGTGMSSGNLPFGYKLVCFNSDLIQESSSTTMALRYNYLFEFWYSFLYM